MKLTDIVVLCTLTKSFQIKFQQMDICKSANMSEVATKVIIKPTKS